MNSTFGKWEHNDLMTRDCLSLRQAKKDIIEEKKTKMVKASYILIASNSHGFGGHALKKKRNL